MEQNYITHAPGTPGTLEGLLNWDHEIHPTPLEDLCDSIHARVARHTGFAKLHVSVVKDVLRIDGQRFRFNNEGRYQWQENLLEADINNSREIYGRSRHVGFSSTDMHVICQYLKKAMLVDKQ